jgi:AraC family transcriptional regulator
VKQQRKEIQVLDRLNQAMEYIERHLDQRIEGAELARIAATSEYHMRRLFSALAGMPLSEYIRRRRLTVAGAEVLAGDRTLLDIAVRYGYGSAEAFARAFRAMHGVGPGEARRTGAPLRSQPRMSFRLVVEGSTDMRYRIVEKDAFQVVGKKARVPLVYEGPNPAIVEFVRSIDPGTLQRLAELSDQEPRGVVAAVANIAGERVSAPEGTELERQHPRTWRCCPWRQGCGRCSKWRERRRTPSNTCGGTCSPSGFPPTPTRVCRGRNCCAPRCRRTEPM